MDKTITFSYLLIQMLAIIYLKELPSVTGKHESYHILRHPWSHPSQSTFPRPIWLRIFPAICFAFPFLIPTPRCHLLFAVLIPLKVLYMFFWKFSKNITRSFLMGFETRVKFVNQMNIKTTTKHFVRQTCLPSENEKILMPVLYFKISERIGQSNDTRIKSRINSRLISKQFEIQPSCNCLNSTKCTMVD